jgi:hypothetical protein
MPAVEERPVKLKENGREWAGRYVFYLAALLQQGYSGINRRAYAVRYLSE